MKQPTAPAAGQSPKVPALSPEIRAKIEERNKILEWLEQGKKREEELRRELVALFVPTPKEGTNNVAGEGFEVKVGHKVSRKLDVAALDSVMAQFPAEHPARVVGNLIQYKPALVLDFYRTLSAEDRKIFDQALTISEDGLPTLEIVLREELTHENAGTAPAVQAEAAALMTGSRAQKKTMTAAEYAAHVGSSTNPTVADVKRAKKTAKPAPKPAAKPSAKKPAPKRKK